MEVTSLPSSSTTMSLVSPPTVIAARQIPSIPLNIQQIIAASSQITEQQKVDLPAFYNPKVVNAAKFAEQQQKRKLLWAAKKEEPPSETTALWSSAKFSHDTDGVKANKFMRLMGIKDGEFQT